MIRIAISAENNDGLNSVVSHHFGRGPYFVLPNLEMFGCCNLLKIIPVFYEDRSTLSSYLENPSDLVELLE